MAEVKRNIINEKEHNKKIAFKRFLRTPEVEKPVKEAEPVKEVKPKKTK